MKLNALSTIVALAFIANSAFATPPEKQLKNPFLFLIKLNQVMT